MECIYCLGVFGKIHTLEQDRDHIRLIAVHNKFFVPHSETTLKPARGVQHEVNARQSSRLKGISRLVSRLCIGQFRGAQATTTSIRHTESTCERRSGVDNLAGLWRTKRWCARRHRYCCRKRSENNRAPGANELCQRDTSHRFRENLSTGASDSHRRHGTCKNKGRHHTGLVVSCIDFQRSQHGSIKDQGRVHVNQARKYAVLINKLITEYKLRHVN